MAQVVFLRAVNVGGANRCQPAQIAKELAKFDVVNIGAVGTFVVREKIAESALRGAIAKKLPFKCEIVICRGNEIADLANENPFTGERGDDIDAHVTIIAKRPAKVLKLPLYLPSADKWEIKIAKLVGRAVICLRRRIRNGRLYPNAVVEKQFGVPGTTRSWNTIEKVRQVLTADGRA